MPSEPAVVTLHLWGVPRSAVPSALAHMALDRRRVRRHPGVTFAKLLGTGSGRTFGVADADPRHWGLLTVWDAHQPAAAFERSRLVRGWDSRSDERLRLTLAPLSAKGRWSGREPFGRPAPVAVAGPVAAITRARLRASLAPTFWRSVPPVSAELHESEGLLLALGIGEAPVGLQGTFSVWRTSEDLSTFAYRRPEHAAVVRRTHETGWYAEELFARFRVLKAEGTFAGHPLQLPGVEGLR
jgi:hypothetical protein